MCVLACVRYCVTVEPSREGRAVGRVETGGEAKE
jgi:hypothetical protein